MGGMETSRKRRREVKKETNREWRWGGGGHKMCTEGESER